MKYNENKFKLLKAETENAKYIQDLDVQKTLLFSKQLRQKMEKEDPLNEDEELKELMSKRETLPKPQAKKKVSSKRTQL